MARKGSKRDLPRTTRSPPQKRQEAQEEEAPQKPQQQAQEEEEAPPSHSPMKDLWKEAFPVGTEWDNFDRVYEIKWDFSNLEQAVQEGGKLYGEKVFLFGCTEPQMVQVGDVRKVVQIPAIIAVVSPQEPSDKLGVKSVQMVGETIVPMKEMKMGWVPYMPADRNVSVERFKCNIFTLKCVQRRVALKHLKEERVKKYDYCLPYFNNPFEEEEKEPDTVVSIMYPLEGDSPPLITDFDWAFDDIDEVADNLIKEESLPAEEREKFKDFVKQTVAAEKKQQRQAKEERRKKIEEMSAETKALYEKIRFYKFYPVSRPGSPDISEFKSPFINRYYGKASEVL